jgi:hypothetical protein
MYNQLKNDTPLNWTKDDYQTIIAIIKDQNDIQVKLQQLFRNESEKLDIQFINYNNNDILVDTYYLYCDECYKDDTVN